MYAIGSLPAITVPTAKEQFEAVGVKALDILDDFLMAAARHEARHADVEVRPETVEYAGIGTSLLVGGHKMVLTEHALRQIISLTGPAVGLKSMAAGAMAAYLTATNTKFPAIMASFVPDLMWAYSDKEPDKTWLFRGYGDYHAGNTEYDLASLINGVSSHTPSGEGYMRSVHSSRYAIVNNKDLMGVVVDAIRGIADNDMEGLSGMFSWRSTLTPDDLRLNVVVAQPEIKSPNVDSANNLPGGMRGDKKRPYGIGFSVSNNEIGRGGISISPFVVRSVCGNGLVFFSDSTVFRHVGDASVKKLSLASAVIGVLGEAGAKVQLIEEAFMKRLPKIGDIVTGMAKEYGWSDEVRSAVLIGTESSETVGGLMNGISFAAHSVTTNPVDEYDMMALAGNVVTASVPRLNRYAERSQIES